MTLTTTWLSGLLRRRRGRIATAAAGVAIAVALLASLGAFLASSRSAMTARIAKNVTVAWQVQLQPGTDVAAVSSALAGTAGLDHALTVEYARTTGFAATTGSTTQTTGPGVVVGLPTDYRTTFADQLRPLTGATDGVLLAQQTAANLHAAPGDTITIGTAGRADVTVTIAGIVEMPNADTFFQTVSAPATSQPTAPPDNVLVVPAAMWHSLFDPLAGSRPDLTTTQVHATYDRALPADPSAAYSRVLADANKLELALTGRATVGDNLAARLASARSDSLYAQILFLFLGLPGTVLAGFLTATIAAGGADRRRREQALLRTRGATTRTLVGLATAEAGLVTIVGAAAGLVTAAVLGRVAFGTAHVGVTTATTVAWMTAATIAGAAIATAAIVLPAWRDARHATVAAARQTLAPSRTPRWLRWYLDLVVLAASIVTYRLTTRHGFHLVLAVEGVPTIAVNYWAFVGPALLWLAAALLTWRLTEFALRRGRAALARVARPVAGPLADTVAASVSRQRRLVARALTLAALTTAFAASTAAFNATYQHQAAVDAVLTNGADVAVTEPPGAAPHPAAAAALAAVPGVRRVTSLQHRFAYVGNDLQDLYGVDPATIVAATKLQDTYFQGGTARQLMARLAAQPDSILVSAETARDYQLSPGDAIHLRLQDARTKQSTDVTFTYRGIVNEFPTAPTDSFLVANAAYVATQTGNDAVGAFLVDTNHRATTAVAKRVQSIVGPGAQVSDIAATRRTIGASLTSIELAGLTRVELGFALVLAAAATGLVLWVGLHERRRTLAIAAALGAGRRQLASFVWTEAAIVFLGGLAFGAVGAAALTRMNVRILTGVFDPPPTTTVVPWSYLALFVAIATVATLVAAVGTVRATRRPAIEVLRDL